MRTIGFSSRPPFCRLARVTVKSAPLRAADAAKRATFRLSQNLCSAVAAKLEEVTTGAAGSMVGVGASGEGPCARRSGQSAAIAAISTTIYREHKSGLDRKSVV